MKRIKYFISSIIIISATVIFIIGGCSKQKIITNDKTINDLSMNSLIVDPNFDWKLIRDVTFNISSTKQGVIKITSEDNNIVYHKGYYNNGEEDKYIITVNFPKNVKNVLINSEVVDITTDIVDHHCTNFKSGRASAASLVFDGIDDFVDFGNDASLNGLNTLTLESWVFINSYPTGAGRGNIIGKYLSPAPYRSYETYINSSGKAVFRVGISSGSLQSVTGTTTLDLEEWYFIAGTYDGSDIKIYVNGNLENLKAVTGNIAYDGQHVYLGRVKVNDSYFTGQIDEVRIWDVARTQAEIISNMDATLLGNEPNLVGYWSIEEGAGTTTSDLTANANHGSIDGALWSSYGGATDSDGDGVNNVDDDYPNDPTRAFDNYFPAAGFGSLGFEDLWPGKGDYDFNDIVVDYQFETITNATNSVVEIFATFAVKATGAFFHSGFGFNLPNSSPAFIGNPWKLTVTGYDIQEGYITLNAFGHEHGQTHPTIIVFDDVFNSLSHPGNGTGVNTEESAPFVDYDTIIVKMVPNGVFSQANFSLTSWNPFIIVEQTRGHEVHLLDYGPTDLVDNNYFGMWEDDSDPVTGKYYKTVNNLPWAIDIPTEFDYPKEKADITQAYLHFSEWAESSGTLYSDWYEDNAGYRNSANIYNHP